MISKQVLCDKLHTDGHKYLEGDKRQADWGNTMDNLFYGDHTINIDNDVAQFLISTTLNNVLIESYGYDITQLCYQLKFNKPDGYDVFIIHDRVVVVEINYSKWFVHIVNIVLSAGHVSKAYVQKRKFEIIEHGRERWSYRDNLGRYYLIHNGVQVVGNVGGVGSYSSNMWKYCDKNTGMGSIWYLIRNGLEVARGDWIQVFDDTSWKYRDENGVTHLVRNDLTVASGKSIKEYVWGSILVDGTDGIQRLYHDGVEIASGDRILVHDKNTYSYRRDGVTTVINPLDPDVIYEVRDLLLKYPNLLRIPTHESEYTCYCECSNEEGCDCQCCNDIDRTLAGWVCNLRPNFEHVNAHLIAGSPTCNMFSKTREETLTWLKGLK